MSPQRLPRRYSEKPRRVRGGKKLRATDRKSIGTTPLGQLWIELIESIADPPTLNDGFEYATLGQVLRIDVLPGLIEARVQGRSPRPYTVRINIDVFTTSEWDRIIRALASEARHAAGLLRGEIARDVLRILDELGLPLIPTRANQIHPHCQCADRAGRAGKCKHVLAVAYLISHQMDIDQSVALALRGMPNDQVIERLRIQRDLDLGGGTTFVLASPDLPEAHEEPEPLESQLESFWQAGPELREVSTSIEPPEVTHALLRRLGPSPFDAGRFPMLGLFATCYDIISKSAQAEQLLSRRENHDDGADDAPTNPGDDPVEDDATKSGAGTDPPTADVDDPAPADPGNTDDPPA